MEGPWPCTSVVLRSLTMRELHNRNAFIGRSYEHTNTQVLCRIKPPKQNKKKKLCQPGFITIPSINYDQVKLGYDGILEYLTENYAWTTSQLSRSIRLISIPNKFGFTSI